MDLGLHRPFITKLFDVTALVIGVASYGALGHVPHGLPTV